MKLDLSKVNEISSLVVNLKDVYFDIPRGKVTALIGPSGCGKSTILRAINRMNDLIPSCNLKGRILFNGKDLYDPNIDPVEVRRRIGMVFQQPNPFPKTTIISSSNLVERLDILAFV